MSSAGETLVRRRGWFVTGTDTGVGKTAVAASIVAGLRFRGHAVTALKPLITGLDDDPDPEWPPDHVLLARVSGASPEATIFAGYGPAVSPHLAVELSGGVAPSAQWLASRVHAAGAPGSVLVVEGAGGLLVPLGPHEDMRDLAVAVGLALVIAARPGLGTINHTLLTLEAARAVGLTVAGVVLTPWPDQPDAMLRSNRDTIAARGAVEVATLPTVTPQPGALAIAGANLPLDRWLSADGASDRHDG
jgi:dethiobiotin synthetase